ncbi:MAG: hypothetical protein WCW35_14030 [Bacteroidota bacterium]|jgi:hypothetical protein
MSEYGMKPIWYFVGLILMVMGSIIFLAGVNDFMNPPDIKTILAELHPGIWWGAVMVLFGSVMFLKTRKGSV